MFQSAMLYNDMSTITTFTNWATVVSGWIATCGWTQTKELGQVMWTGLSLSAVSMSGSNATYTYGSLTGMPLQVGRALTITGMTNSVNNGTFVITAFTGTTSGTFTVVNASGVNESGSSGVVTKITSPPGTNVFVYEFWTPGDSLAPYLLKVEYGTIGGSNSPTMRISAGITTNGSGTFYGWNTYGNTTYTDTPCPTSNFNYGATGTSVPYACYFSGDSGRLMVYMWRNNPNNASQFFAIERSVNSSGAWTGTHVTLMSAGAQANNNSAYPCATQVTLHLATYGRIPYVSYNGWTNPVAMAGFTARVPQFGGQTGISNSYNPYVNSETCIDTVAPYIGYFDYQLTSVGLGNPYGLNDGQVVTTTLYGATRTYITAYNGYLPWTSGDRASMVYLRYD